MNKLEIRRSIADAVTSWIKWKRARDTKNGMSLLYKREFRDAMDQMTRAMLLVEPDHPSRVWKEAYKLVELWITTKHIGTRAMLRLINAYNVNIYG